MLKREKPNKISRSPSRLCCFSGLSKKKNNRLEGQLLFSIFVLLKKGRKKAERTGKGHF